MNSALSYANLSKAIARFPVTGIPCILSTPLQPSVKCLTESASPKREKSRRQIEDELRMAVEAWQEKYDSSTGITNEAASKELEHALKRLNDLILRNTNPDDL